MPIIVLIALRYCIIWAIQIGVVTLAEKYGIPLLNAGIAKLMETLGVDEDTATDIMANEYLQMAESFAVGVAVLMSKTPLKIADKLKFTKKGWSRRTIPSTAAAKVQSAKGSAPSASPSLSQTATAIQEIALARAPQYASNIRSFFELTAKVLGVTSLLWLAIINTIDFGNWNGGAYQKTFNKFFSYFGLDPDKHLAKSTQLSSDLWTKVYNFYKIRGAVGISDPQEKVDYPFTSENLVTVVDKAAAIMIADGQTPKLQSIIAATQLFIIWRNGNPEDTTADPPFSASGTSTPPAGQQPVKTQIFTGVVANGVLGAPKVFESVGDGYITSNNDLMATASGTLANFILTLPAKFQYEIAIVNSFKSPGGFTLKGEPVQVVTGHLKDGTPKYKTIYKKFAVLHVWILNDNGQKITLLKENMGQVNATDFTPTPQQLAAVSASITPSIFTSNVEHITGIESNAAVTVSSPAAPAAAPSPVVVEKAPTVAEIKASELSPEMKARIAAAPQTQYKFYKYSVNGVDYFAADAYAGNTPYGYTPITAAEFLSGGLAFRAKHPVDGARYVTDEMLALARAASPDASGAGQSPYVLVDGVPFKK